VERDVLLFLGQAGPALLLLPDLGVCGDGEAAGVTEIGERAEICGYAEGLVRVVVLAVFWRRRCRLLQVA
jgi:hypothetical protein